MKSDRLFVFYIIFPVFIKCLIAFQMNITKITFNREKTCLPKDGKQMECVETWRCPQFMEQTQGQFNLNFPWDSVCNINMEFDIMYVCCEIEKYRIIDQSSTHIELSTNHGPNQNICGRQRVKADYSVRIVGGVEARLGEFPWLAWIEYDDGFGSVFYACGSSLISDKWVLTAAHCIEIDQMPEATPINIVLGDHDLTKNPDCNKNGDCADPVQKILIDKTIMHPRYNKVSISPHDIALVSLKRRAVFTKYVQPICLLNHEIPNNVHFWVSGWGRTIEGTLSMKKLKVDVPRVSMENCKSTWQYATEDQICAGGELHKDSCQGDSGGPLMFLNQNTWFLAGVVSYGHPECGTENTPAIYTKVSNYINWINENIKGDPYSQYNSHFFVFLRGLISGSFNKSES